MFNLIKYEFLRKYKLILMTISSALLINLFLVTKGIGGSSAFLVFFPFVLAILYVSDIIRMYGDDLNKKSGYMLFMTPNSGYKIILSKLITAILEGLVIILLYFVFILLNGAYIIYAAGDNINFAEVMRTINSLLSGNLGFSLGHVFVILFVALVFIIGFIVTAYTAMTIRKSIFSEFKFGGLLSFLIFIGLNWFTTFTAGKFHSIFSPYYNSYLNINSVSASELLVVLFPVIAISILQSIILTTFSGYLLEKKINL
ncbi:MAG: hypothetical protein ACERLG_03535 [Sedimentibacter sp.]